MVGGWGGGPHGGPWWWWWWWLVRGLYCRLAGGGYKKGSLHCMHGRRSAGGCDGMDGDVRALTEGRVRGYLPARRRFAHMRRPSLSALDSSSLISHASSISLPRRRRRLSRSIASATTSVRTPLTLLISRLTHAWHGMGRRGGGMRARGWVGVSRGVPEEWEFFRGVPEEL